MMRMAKKKHEVSRTAKFVIVAIIIVIMTVAIFLLITKQPTRSNDDLMLLDYRVGRISTADYVAYKDMQGISAMRVGAAIAFCLVGLGVTIHGIRMVGDDVNNVHPPMEKGDKNGVRRKN
jgi:hypothetical protein